MSRTSRDGGRFDRRKQGLFWLRGVLLTAERVINSILPISSRNDNALSLLQLRCCKVWWAVFPRSVVSIFLPLLACFGGFPFRSFAFLRRTFLIIMINQPWVLRAARPVWYGYGEILFYEWPYQRTTEWYGCYHFFSFPEGCLLVCPYN